MTEKINFGSESNYFHISNNLICLQRLLQENGFLKLVKYIELNFCGE